MAKERILIIGGGIAGISAGIYAQKNNFQSEIIEMHDKVGGQLTSWSRKGYRFDYCLHWLVGTDHGTYRKIWEETGAINEQTQIINHEIFVKMVDENKGEFFIYNDLDTWENYLIEFAPEDHKAIHKLCEMMRKSDQLDQFENPPGLRNITEYIKSFIKMGSFAWTIMKYGKKTTVELFEDLGFKNEKIKFFLNKIFEGQDFSALGFIMMIGWANAKNAGYLEGGSIKMANRMAHTYKSLGGKVSFNTKVAKILVENDQAIGVSLVDGSNLYADHVIAACDLKTILYDMLDDEYTTSEFEEALNEWSLFDPLIMVGIGINEKIKTECHNTNYLSQKSINVGSTKTKMYSIMNRSSYDSHFAPDDKTTLLFQCETDWELWEHLSGVAYDREKENIEKSVIEILEIHYPGISSKIEVVDVATPQTTVHYTGVWKGAYEGFMPTRDVMRELPMELKGLSNFKIIGQWLYPGGGLPPSAQSGKWAIQKILKEEKPEVVF